MAIDQEQACKIDHLINEGMPLVKIAEKMGLNREFVRRYTKGEIKVITQKSTETTQTPNSGSTAPLEGVSLAELQLLRQQVRQDLDKFKEEIPQGMTKDEQYTFRNSIISQVKGAVSDQISSFLSDNEQIKKRLIVLEEASKGQIQGEGQ